MHLNAASRFREMHLGDEGFLMPNAWDAGSALLLTAAGFSAIGTSSAGIAFSLGRPDYVVSDARLAVPASLMLQRVTEIATSVPIPVDSDLEAGYGDTPEAVAFTIRAAIESGLAGANLEDLNPLTGKLFDAMEAADRIAAARSAIAATQAARNDQLRRSSKWAMRI